VAARLSKTGTKRNEFRKTLIGQARHDSFGYRIERKYNFEIPAPVVGNNFYKNHSQVSKKHIYRKFKGPLYNEAGRICIDLTQRYIMLETFCYTTQFENMKF
jgi:hypothetical protein